MDNYYCYTRLERNILHICRYEFSYFFSKDNVVSVGLGLKVTNGILTSNMCIKVFVSKKLSCN